MTANLSHLYALWANLLLLSAYHDVSVGTKTIFNEIITHFISSSVYGATYMVMPLRAFLGKESEYNGDKIYFLIYMRMKCTGVCFKVGL
ncbi:UNVERIFIED_CONTAM: hypothetical protein FKN15_056067 [Acipenser sinensis]